MVVELISNLIRVHFHQDTHHVYMPMRAHLQMLQKLNTLFFVSVGNSHSFIMESHPEWKAGFYLRFYNRKLSLHSTRCIECAERQPTKHTRVRNPDYTCIVTITLTVTLSL